MKVNVEGRQKAGWKALPVVWNFFWAHWPRFFHYI